MYGRREGGRVKRGGEERKRMRGEKGDERESPAHSGKEERNYPSGAPDLERLHSLHCSTNGSCRESHTKTSCRTGTKAVREMHEEKGNSATGWELLEGCDS